MVTITTSDTTKAPSTAALARNVPAMRALPRRETTIYLDHRARSLFRFRHDHLPKQTKSTVKHHPVQTRLGAHVAPRALNAPFGAAGHRAQRQFLERNHIGSVDQPTGDLTSIVAPRIGFPLSRACEAFTCFDPAMLSAVDDSPRAIAHRHRLKLSLEPRRRGPALFAHCRIGNQPAIGQCRQDVYAPIHADHLVACRQRPYRAFTLKARVPAVVLAHHPGTAVGRRDLSPFAQLDGTDVRDAHALLHSVQA